MSGPDHAGSIDFPPDDGQDNGRKVEAVTDVTAASVAFNNAALPPDMPEWFKDHIRAQAATIVQAMQMDDIRLTALKVREDEDREVQTDMWQAVAVRERREREEWMRTQSTVGGITMTGAEWAQFADRLRNDEDLRRRVIDALEKRGMTKAEAEARYERVADISEIAAKPPSQRSEQEAETFKRAQADPTLAQDMKEAINADRLSRGPSAAPQATDSVTAPPATAEPAHRTVTNVAGPGF